MRSLNGKHVNCPILANFFPDANSFCDIGVAILL